MMTPMKEVTENVVFVRNSMTMTPGKPIGIENMMMKGSISDLNCAAITI